MKKQVAGELVMSSFICFACCLCKTLRARMRPLMKLKLASRARKGFPSEIKHIYLNEQSINKPNERLDLISCAHRRRARANLVVGVPFRYRRNGTQQVGTRTREKEQLVKEATERKDKGFFRRNGRANKPKETKRVAGYDLVSSSEPIAIKPPPTRSSYLCWPAKTLSRPAKTFNLPR